MAGYLSLDSHVSPSVSLFPSLTLSQNSSLPVGTPTPRPWAFLLTGDASIQYKDSPYNLLYIIGSSFCSVHYTYMVYPCFSFLLFFNLYYRFICMCLCSLCACMCHGTHMEARGQLIGVTSLSTVGLLELNWARLGSKRPFPLSCRPGSMS